MENNHIAVAANPDGTLGAEASSSGKKDDATGNHVSPGSPPVSAELYLMFASYAVRHSNCFKES